MKEIHIKIAKSSKELTDIKEFRKRDIGKQIVKYISNYIKRKGLKKIILNAQESARGFYEKLGFNQEGDVFEEANIPHVKMYKNLEKWLL